MKWSTRKPLTQPDKFLTILPCPSKFAYASLEREVDVVDNLEEGNIEPSTHYAPITEPISASHKGSIKKIIQALGDGCYL
ncbi:hypothetical protein NPIL_595911 [Nephila pilipes]|uniref:Uncharacterized protein n=1 Tax=Nephila pilipes TaxID=299642 RepID=A0A8X6TDG8_NEPPI|nr:hypothetical protein NPIL_595911 [Nephila pilipes]